MVLQFPLLRYALEKELFPVEDACYVENALLALFGMESPEEMAALPPVPVNASLADLLAAYTTLALRRGLLPEDSVTQRDLFAARLMGLLTMPPSEVRATFTQLAAQSPEAATDWLYALCLHNGYIQTERIAKNVCWQTATPYGALQMTINCSKPEKDPKAIAAASTCTAQTYPACQLCVENEGYAGRLTYPARQNLRIVPVTLHTANGVAEPWFLQYSPYAYFPEHCIVLAERHTPMTITADCFAELLDFVRQFPQYIMGSNADLPIVGGSILSHAHFQGGRFAFPMAKAPMAQSLSAAGFADVTCGIVAWPMTVLRLRGMEPARLVALAEQVRKTWCGYSDPACAILSHTGNTPHHTVTPIARRRGEAFELDLVLRDNHTTDAHPLGLFHPHAELHHIKKENIGLIEVMGLAVLPARLKTELAAVVACLRDGKDLYASEETAKHAAWAAEWRASVPEEADGIHWEEVVKAQVGNVFLRVLAQCGVFADTAQGRAGFLRFLQTVGIVANASASN